MWAAGIDLPFVDRNRGTDVVTLSCDVAFHRMTPETNGSGPDMAATVASRIAIDTAR
jgi:hypothetical protein